MVREAADLVGGDEVAQGGGGALLVDGARLADRGALDDEALHDDDFTVPAEVGIEFDGAVGGDVCGQGKTCVADIVETHLDRASRDVGDGEAAEAVRVGFEGGTLNAHAGSAECELSLVVDDAAGDRAGMGNECGG